MALPVKLSLLDRSRTRRGEPPATALHNTVDRAERAEALGHHRFWVAEHHAVPGVASGSPPVLIATIAERTQRIRVGSGGVMLPNHQPFVVAEQFAMLEAMYPGRIDLGVGRSVGFTAPVRSALRVGRDSREAFFDDLTELRDFLAGRGIVTVSPELASPPPIFVLANERGLEYAARAGLPVVAGGPILYSDGSAFERYRRDFRAADAGAEPYVVVSLDVTIADTEEAARDLQLSEAWALASSRDTGVFPPLEDVPSIKARTLRGKQEQAVRAVLDQAVYGTAADVREQLARLVARTGAAEILASTSTFDRDALYAADAALAELVLG